MGFINHKFIESERPLTYPLIAHKRSPAYNATGDGTAFDIICTTELTDAYNVYNTTTGEATAPVTGLYECVGEIMVSDYSTQPETVGWFEVDTTPTPTQYFFNMCYAANMSSTIQGLAVKGTAVIPLTAGQKVKLVIAVGTGSKTVRIRQDAASVYRLYFGWHRIPE
jgi:hypothetical protein